MTPLLVLFLFQIGSLDGKWEFAKGAERPEKFPLEITVPAAFETAAGSDFDGVGWYRRAVDVPRGSKGRRFVLRFDAVATEAKVWWNGQEVGGHTGAWTPFVIDVTAAAREGPNELVVRVDEKPGHNTQGFLPAFQPHFGGIWQSVRLSAHAGPSIDETSVHAHGDLEKKRFRLTVPLREGPGDGKCQVHLELVDPGGKVAGRKSEAAAAGETVRFELEAEAVKPWSPAEPNLYRYAVKLQRDGQDLDELRGSVGFRDLEARGTSVFLNGRPLLVRGVLHWGFEPPRLAPNPPADVWRTEIADLKRLGFNLIKCCLWVPPRRFYEIADETGMLVWQEYPTWHARITRETKDDLLREFEEFYRHDRGHASVLFRSLTCETGRSADPEVMRALYELCHKTVPDTLVNDDSSWISWSRFHDFYDDHPYLNHDAWVPALRRFKDHVASHGEKPLLLGEAITGDTWIDRTAVLASVGKERPWWLPRCFEAQGPFEEWVIGEFGGQALQRFLPDSLAYAMAGRKYQIEAFRREIPDGGYVVSVLRDFTLARMGLYDALGRMKWGIGEWAWHRDPMFLLRTDGDCRAFVGGKPVKAEILLSLFPGHWSGPEKPSVKVEVRGLESDFSYTSRLELGAGALHPMKAIEASTPAEKLPRRFEVAVDSTKDLGVWNSWRLWVVPPADPPREGLRVVKKLDRGTMEFLKGGGKVLHLASLAKGSLRCQPLAYYRGAPWAPDHPLHEKLPLQMLMELQPFDLAGPGVMPFERLKGQVDPILAFWDTHDQDLVVPWLFAFETRVGKGRLLVSSLEHEEEGNAAARYVLGCFAEHLLRGPAPKRALADKIVAELEQAASADVIQLDEGWKLMADPKDVGVAEKWFETGFDDAKGIAVRAGKHWEPQGLEHYDGVAWYRRSFEVPASFKGKNVTAVFEGVDDSYDLWLNGKWIAKRGDPKTKETVWLVRTTVDLTAAVQQGRNQVTLRVVDHGGAGGLHRQVYVTTGTADAVSDLVN